jgi:imidazolonepropionase-like amidohydrolase
MPVIVSNKLWFALVIAMCTACAQPIQHDLIIQNVHIIDVETGAIAEQQTIGIDGGIISAIYPDSPPVAQGVQLVDGTNKYLIPGLWDMHVHHRWNHEDADPLLLANGVTGVREMWGDMFVANQLRAGIEAGSMDVPDLYVGSVIIDGKPEYWPGSIGVSSPEEARAAALAQIESGVDFLKVYSLLTKEAFDAIAEVAAEQGVPFAGHVPEAITIQHAAEQGMSSAEHMYGVLLGASAKRDSLLAAGVPEYLAIRQAIRTFSQASFDSLCAILVEQDLWMCPTLITNKGAAFQPDPDYSSDERLAYLPAYMKPNWVLDSAILRNPEAQAYYDQQKTFFEAILPLVGQMSDRGVRFLAGTDFPNPFCFPGFSLHDELALMVEGGMEPLTALQTATLNPAIFMKKTDRYGSVDPGKVASLLLLDHNPLVDIRHSQAIHAVVLRGKVFERPALDQLLAEVKADLAKPALTDWLRDQIDQQGTDIALDSLTARLQDGGETYRFSERAMNALGYSYLNAGDIFTAQAVLKQNVDLFPESPNVYDSYAEVCLAAGQFEAAREAYTQLLKLTPYATNARMMLDSLQQMIPE